MTSEETKKSGGRKGISRRKFIAVAATGVVAGAAVGVAGGYLGAPKTTSTLNQTVTTTSTLPVVTTTQTTTETTTTTVSPPGPVLTTLTVNGQNQEVQIDSNETLQHALQFKLGLTGAKTMCDHGECGSCSVIIDGKAVLSCTTLAVECVGKTIQTVEGIAADPNWAPLIQSYTKWDTAQCGYCNPGFLVTAKAFLVNNPKPTVDQIKQALSGNICRCGTYPRHPIAIMEAAPLIKGGSA